MAVEKSCFKIKDGVSITDEVVAIISGLAATEVEGVASLEGNLKNKALEKAGFKKLSQGVSVKMTDEGDIKIKLSINTEYGVEIPSISAAVQEKVKTTVENMTGITVASVDVIVSSVILENTEPK